MTPTPDPDQQAAPAPHAGDRRPVLVTGATGYIGGRLVPRLLDAGWPVRVLARSPAKLTERPWTDHPGLDIVAGDVGDPASLGAAMQGCGAAYYLVHSMLAAGRHYRAQDAHLASSRRTSTHLRWP